MKNLSLPSPARQTRIALSTVILISLSASINILPSRAQQNDGYPGSYQAPQYSVPQRSENTTSPNDSSMDERDNTQSDSEPTNSYAPQVQTPSNRPSGRPSGSPSSTWTAPASKPMRSVSVPMTSNLIADVAESLAPSVVNIDVAETRKTMSIPWDTDLLKRFFGFDMDAPLGGSKNYNQKQSQSQPAETTVVTGSGSGMIMDSQGYILTNNHVVSSASKMTVTLNDGRRFPARLIGRDSYSDVAIIKIDAPNLRPIHLGNSDSLRPGEWVIAVGSPLGYDHTVTQGIISALARRIPELNSNVSFIQTDAAINPGNSGGPLANLNGEVIGVNTAISGRGQNIGFAIPINTVKDIANSLITGKPIVRPWVGIAMTDLNPDLAKQMGIASNSTGVVVERVNPGSPAEQAGLQSGDLIRRVNGAVMDKADKFQSLVRSKAPGTRLTLDILRDGKPITLHLITGTLPSEDQIEANNYSLPAPSQALAPRNNKGSGQGKVRQFSGKTPEGAQYWGYTQQYP